MSNITEILLRFVVVKVEVLIVVLKLCDIFVTAFYAFFFREVNKVCTAVGDEYVANLALFLLVVVSKPHATGLSQLRYLTLHVLVLLAHYLHLTLKVLILLRKVIKQIRIVLERVYSLKL